MVPIFDEYSGGLFSKRFSSIDSSGRFDISLAEIEIFSKNIISGVGPGGANKYFPYLYGHRTASHNEFSRLLSEHGIIGFYSIPNYLLYYY